jgi:hypothetical protein
MKIIIESKVQHKHLHQRLRFFRGFVGGGTGSESGAV